MPHGVLHVILYIAALAVHVNASRTMQRLHMASRQRGSSMVAKVIQMLGQETEKIKTNLESESHNMDEYSAWCDDSSDEKFFAIKTANTKIEDLTAIKVDNGAQIQALEEEILDLGNEMAERQTEMDEATSQRTKDKEQFERAQEEQALAVEELEKMELALKNQMAAAATTPPPLDEGTEFVQASPATEDQQSQGTYDAFLQIRSKTKRASSALESLESLSESEMSTLFKAMTTMVNSLWVDPESKRNLAQLQKSGTFIQQPEDAEAQMAEMQQTNQDNLAAFESLKGKAEESLQKLRDSEVKAQHEFAMNMAALKQAVALCQDKLDDAKKEKAQLAEEKGKAEQELSEVQDAKAADQKGLAQIQQECQQGAVAYELRKKSGAAEIAAINKAKEILEGSVTVFLQLKATTRVEMATQHSASKARQALIDHFRALGSNLHSLAMLNLVTVASSDPMEQVKNLLKDLVDKLVKEAAEAASLHKFCQEEKNKTADALAKKNMQLDKLTARIEKSGTTKQDLEEDVAQLTAEIADINKADAEATKIRNEEHAEFLKADEDFSQAAEAVDDAIDALKEYYGDTSFLQTDSVTGDEIFGSESDSESNTERSADTASALGGARSDSAGGIIGILETIGEEFRKTVKENTGTEREAQKAFNKMIVDNKVAKASKTASIKGNTMQINILAQNLHEFGGDKKMVSNEIAAVEEYIAKLKPQCQGRTVPYAVRKAKRDAEIQGLKEGLAIIDAESPAGGISFLQVQLHRQ